MGDPAPILTIQDLGRLLKDRRKTKGIGLRTAAEQSGVSFNTLSRVERGHVPDLETFTRVARWIGRSPADFLGQVSVTPDSTPDRIEAHLRGDRALSPVAAGRIAGIVREFYSQLAKPAEVAVACHLRAASTFTPETSALFSELLQQMHNALVNEE